VTPVTTDPRLAWTLIEPYVGHIGFACDARQPREDLALVVAIGLRETHLGTCWGYSPQGPNGRGDGGHGRGLFQIDDRGPFKYLIPPDGADWPVFVQASCACIVLAQARLELAAFRGALAPRSWEEAVACRYNAKLENVVWSLRAGRDPNLVTTPGPLAPVDPVTGKRLGDYGRDVLALRDGLRRLYPSIFPTVAGLATNHT